LTRRAVLALAALLLLAAACGDDDQGNDGPTPVQATVGPAAQLPRGLKSVTPGHAAQLSPDAVQTTRVCVTLALLEGDGITDQPQDVASLTLNLEDISDSLVWTNTDDNPTSEATGCYLPPEPLAPGVHAATLRYTDKAERNFIYNWQFEVTD
jgi:nitrous oxide reductase accessory protein NosL